MDPVREHPLRGKLFPAHQRHVQLRRRKWGNLFSEEFLLGKEFLFRKEFLLGEELLDLMENPERVITDHYIIMLINVLLWGWKNIIMMSMLAAMHDHTSFWIKNDLLVSLETVARYIMLKIMLA